MAVRSPTINVMTEAALKASRALVRDFGEVEQLQVSRKGPADFVTAADLKAEKTLRRELSKARPDYGFLLEEGGEVEGDGRHRWIVDPLDGTLNFLHGLPHFAISIGLERDGDIVAGVIHDPIRHETFWAERGAGAYLNDHRLRVSERKRLDESIIATGIPFMGREGHAPYLAQIGALMPLVAGIRRYGSAALDLAYVAAGRYEGFWEAGLSIWDIAAGILIVRESGGFVSELDGRSGMLRSGDVLAANGRLHGELQKILRNA
ncbi:MAG: inositol monophosphatase [Rhodospirillaceae bacterium]|jgi:myo-inositol-1(or 4)-monophosphatase|nr:inositol monophosphatase [Rhodospirillaceae bacterium]